MKMNKLITKPIFIEKFRNIHFKFNLKCNLTMSNFNYKCNGCGKVIKFFNVKNINYDNEYDCCIYIYK